MTGRRDEARLRRLLSLLYACPHSAVVRRAGRLEVVRERTDGDNVVMTQDQLHRLLADEDGVERLLKLALVA